MTVITRGESSERRKETVAHVVTLLKAAYPQARIVLHYSNSWELLVSVILSAQCTDVMVNKVTEKLFTKYPTLEDYVHADIKVFEQDIKSTGFYHNKAKNILAAAKLIREKFSGIIPRTMDEMLTIPGVARKTANVVLGNAYGVVEGIAVDTHVLRLSQRLRIVDLDKIGGKKSMVFKRDGLAKPQDHLLKNEQVVVDYKKDADPVKIERELMDVIPKSDWFKLTYLLIDHGRAVCKAQNPDCAHCMLRILCPASRTS
ncbi:MAG: endonuclease III [Candidatus Gottesmanbacteria bacterium]|nr:endonuclease III [Candidatus Gottesmanbacteria bacterium]